MKNIKGLVSTAFVIIIIGGLLIGISVYQKDRSRGELASRILVREPNSAAMNIDDLKSSIALYERRIERHVADAGKTATYWKILSTRLMDRKLYGEALETLEQAILYSPEDSALQYYTGIAAGVMVKSVHSFPGRENRERERYFALAEKAYLRSIELDTRYMRARYGLAVLYVFELERPADAIVHLEKCLEISRGDVDSMFVLARAYYMMGNLRSALDLYDRIITLTGDEQKRKEAENNRNLIMGQRNG